MIQYYRHPRDVIGDDPHMLRCWNDMPPHVRLQLLKSNISVSTPGELQLLQGQLERREP